MAICILPHSNDKEKQGPTEMKKKKHQGLKKTKEIYQQFHHPAIFVQRKMKNVYPGSSSFIAFDFGQYYNNKNIT